MAISRELARDHSHRAFRQATDPDLERARKLQAEHDMQAGYGKLFALRLRHTDCPADALVVTDTYYGFVHDLGNTPISLDENAEQTTLESIGAERAMGMGVEDILKQTQIAIQSSTRLSHIPDQLVIIDLTTKENPVGLSRKGDVTSSGWCLRKKIEANGDITELFVVNKKELGTGRLNWA